VEVTDDGVHIRGFNITIGGDPGWSGINIFSYDNCRVEECILFENQYGINLESNANNNVIIGNNVSYSSTGIRVCGSSGNAVANNTIEDNFDGIGLVCSSSGNTVVNNTCRSNSGYALTAFGSSNQLHHNNVIYNNNQGRQSGVNQWDDGNGEGNHWSDYLGLDNGAGGRVAGDGIGDTAIPHLGLDGHPFIHPSGWLLPGAPILDDPGDVDHDGNYTLTWADSVRTTGYVLEEDQSADFTSPTAVYNGTALSFGFTSKEDGTYYYRLRNFNDIHENAWSDAVDITVNRIPAIPRDLQVDVYPHGNALNLSWEPNAEDTVAYCLSYQVSGDWEPLVEIAHPGNAYNHSGLQDGRRYRYRIQAKDDQGLLSDYSDIVEGFPADSVAPSVPTGLRIDQVTNCSIRLVWNANPENEVVGYNIYRSGSGDPDDWGDPVNGDAYFASTSYQDGHLDESMTFHYTVTALDEVPNESGLAGSVTGTTLLGPYGPCINIAPEDFDIAEDGYCDSAVNLQEWFTDANGDSLSFWCEGQDQLEVTIYQGNGTVALVPERDWNGVETLTFYACDDTAEVSAAVNVTVTAVNDAPEEPVITSPSTTLSILNGTTIDLRAECFDADVVYGDVLTFDWSSNLTGPIGQGEELEEVLLETGTHTITLEVSDGDASSSAIAYVLVFEENDGQEGEGEELPGDGDDGREDVTGEENETGEEGGPEEQDGEGASEKQSGGDLATAIGIAATIAAVILLALVVFSMRRGKKGDEGATVGDGEEEETSSGEPGDPIEDPTSPDD
jgi:parallel beta-helix repeat protein